MMPIRPGVYLGHELVERDDRQGLLRRQPHGRAFLYEPVSPREQTLRSLLGETLERVYNGSASLLVAHLLDQSHPSATS